MYMSAHVCVHSDVDLFSQERRKTREDKKKNLEVFWLHEKIFCWDLSSSIVQECNSSIAFDFSDFLKIPSLQSL